MLRAHWGWIVALSAALAAPAWPQLDWEEAGPLTPQDPAMATLWEDIRVLRGVEMLRLTPDQMDRLVRKLQEGHAGMQKAERADLDAWVAATRALREAIPQAARGASTTAAEMQFVAAQGMTKRKLTPAYEDAKKEIRVLLDQILTPPQKATVVAAGRAEIIGAWPAHLGPADPGQAERLGRELDKLRAASAEQYPQVKEQFIDRLKLGALSDRENAAEDEREAAEEEADPEGAQARKAARWQTAGQRQEAYTRQFGPLADRVRAMQPLVYSARRAGLARQLAQMRGRVQAMATPPEQLMEAFVIRYLLLPRAPIVLEERLKAMQG